MNIGDIWWVVQSINVQEINDISALSKSYELSFVNINFVPTFDRQPVFVAPSGLSGNDSHWKLQKNWLASTFSKRIEWGIYFLCIIGWKIFENCEFFNEKMVGNVKEKRGEGDRDEWSIIE